MINIKRVYDFPQREDGVRILVDRLWPRGLSKERAQVDLWLKAIAPSDKLRKWFAHDPAKWEGFEKHYRKELSLKKELLGKVKEAEKKSGTVTLLYSAKDMKYNNAQVLLNYLRKQ